jgi:hypothetical protein
MQIFQKYFNLSIAMLLCLGTTAPMQGSEVASFDDFSTVYPEQDQFLIGQPLAVQKLFGKKNNDSKCCTSQTNDQVLTFTLETGGVIRAEQTEEMVQVQVTTRSFVTTPNGETIYGDIERAISTPGYTVTLCPSTVLVCEPCCGNYTYGFSFYITSHVPISSFQPEMFLEVSLDCDTSSFETVATPVFSTIEAPAVGAFQFAGRVVAPYNYTPKSCAVNPKCTCGTGAKPRCCACR